MLIIALLAVLSIVSAAPDTTYDTIDLAISGKAAGSIVLNVPPRYMWGLPDDTGWESPGYCGETSIQSAGLLFGNYISQEVVHQAGGGTELLVGTGNDIKAAAALSFNYASFNTATPKPQASAFNTWMKTYLDRGAVVITGFYDTNGANLEYDHIMPIIGYSQSSGVINGLYYNDLVNDFVSYTQGFSRSRKQCSSGTSPWCLPSNALYGLTILGNKFPGSVPAQLFMDTWNEPDWGSVNGLHEKPIATSGTLVVSNLALYSGYSCLRFDSPARIPTTGNFLAGAYAAKFDFTAVARTHSIKVANMMSNGQYYFRCVGNSLVTDPKYVQATVTLSTKASLSTARTTTWRTNTAKTLADSVRVSATRFNITTVAQGTSSVTFTFNILPDYGTTNTNLYPSALAKTIVSLASTSGSSLSTLDIDTSFNSTTSTLTACADGSYQVDCPAVFTTAAPTPPPSDMTVGNLTYVFVPYATKPTSAPSTAAPAAVPIGLIVGAVVGGVILLAVLSFVVYKMFLAKPAQGLATQAELGNSVEARA